MTLQIFWPKPGNPREGGQKGGTNGREGGGEGGSRAKPGNQLVVYKAHAVNLLMSFVYLFIFIFILFYFFFSSFPHGVFIVRKLTVISIAPIQYRLAHLN